MPEWLLGKFCGSLHTTHQPRPITCHAPSHASEQPLSGHNSLDQTSLKTPVPHSFHSYQSPPPATSPLPQLHRPVPVHLPWSVQTVSGQTWSRGQPESWRERPRQSARSHRAPCLYPTLTCTHVHSYIRRRRQPHSQHTLIRV